MCAYSIAHVAPSVYVRESLSRPSVHVTAPGASLCLVEGTP